MDVMKLTLASGDAVHGNELMYEYLKEICSFHYIFPTKTLEIIYLKL
jgi:hypothetical protein